MDEFARVFRKNEAQPGGNHAGEGDMNGGKNVVNQIWEYRIQ